MLRVISQTLVGLALLASGLYFAFIFLQGLADNSAAWAMVCAVPMVIIGIFFLFRAGKSDDTVFKKTKIPQLGESQSTAGEGFANKLKNDNQMMAEWSKTNITKDRLRMMEIGAKAESEQ